MTEETSLLADLAGLETQEGYIRDYISGRLIRETPEEILAVQVFARRLVEDFG
jgi:type I restriction enzyme M protein